MKHTILSGSSRKNSISLRVSKGLARVLKEQGENEVEVVSFEDYDIPFFNQDIDPENLSAFQERLANAMRSAESIIFVTPEYNWFPSAEMVNLVHRFADTPFRDLWDEKVLSFVGVSNGRGGRMPTVQLGYVIDKIISVFGFESLTNPKSLEVQFAIQLLGERGDSLGNPEFDRGMKAFIAYHIRLSRRWKSEH